MKYHLPLGESDFRRIRLDGDYYIDKTLLIQEVIDANRVVLITRPRRFGKTLNMTTMRYFYDCREDYRTLFEGLNIMQAGERYLAKMGKHPVIFMSFKDIKKSNWKEAYESLTRQIRAAYESYKFDLKKLDLSEQNLAERFLQGKPLKEDFETCLKVLCKALFLTYNANPVILIDEYDTPLISAWLDNYYMDCVELMRDMFSGGLKDNPWLEKAVITGIVRVSKESLFSGLNNLTVFSTLEKYAADKFGFTEPEVEKLLQDCELNGKQLQDIREWYNGYTIGSALVYNPWSVLSYVDEQPDQPKAYWVNTSDNRMIKELLFKGEATVRADIEALMAGKWLEKSLNPHLVFQDLRKHQGAVWNLLLFAGYLKIRNIQVNEMDSPTCELAIPNREVRSVFSMSVLHWLEDQLSENKFDEMLRYLLAGRIEPFNALLKEFVINVVSFHDTAKPETENFYHAFFLGMFIKLADKYHIRSNRESGYGRYDILMIPIDKTQKGIVIEVKAPMAYFKEKTLRQALNAAVKQLKTQAYATELLAQGVTEVMHIAIAVEGKECLVKEVPMQLIARI